ncbi:MAG: hypothetical protein D6785_04140, partial [Planctomycetota bacterium]
GRIILLMDDFQLLLQDPESTSFLSHHFLPALSFYFKQTPFLLASTPEKGKQLKQLFPNLPFFALVPLENEKLLQLAEKTGLSASFRQEVFSLFLKADPHHSFFSIPLIIKILSLYQPSREVMPHHAMEDAIFLAVEKIFDSQVSKIPIPWPTIHPPVHLKIKALEFLASQLLYQGLESKFIHENQILHILKEFLKKETEYEENREEWSQCLFMDLTSNYSFFRPHPIHSQLYLSFPSPLWCFFFAAPRMAQLLDRSKVYLVPQDKGIRKTLKNKGPIRISLQKWLVKQSWNPEWKPFFLFLFHYLSPERSISLLKSIGKLDKDDLFFHQGALFLECLGKAEEKLGEKQKDKDLEFLKSHISARIFHAYWNHALQNRDSFLGLYRHGLSQILSHGWTIDTKDIKEGIPFLLSKMEGGKEKERLMAWRILSDHAIAVFRYFQKHPSRSLYERWKNRIRQGWKSPEWQIAYYASHIIYQILEQEFWQEYSQEWQKWIEEVFFRNDFPSGRLSLKILELLARRDPKWLDTFAVLFQGADDFEKSVTLSSYACLLQKHKDVLSSYLKQDFSKWVQDSPLSFAAYLLVLKKEDKWEEKLIPHFSLIKDTK